MDEQINGMVETIQFLEKENEKLKAQIERQKKLGTWKDELIKGMDSGEVFLLSNKGEGKTAEEIEEDKQDLIQTNKELLAVLDEYRAEVWAGEHTSINELHHYFNEALKHIDTLGSIMSRLDINEKQADLVEAILDFRINMGNYFKQQKLEALKDNTHQVLKKPCDHLDENGELSKFGGFCTKCGKEVDNYGNR